MKLLAIVILFSSFSLFAQDAVKPESTNTRSFGNILVDEVNVDVTIVDRGWRTEGSVYPTLNITSEKRFSFEYLFETKDFNTIEGIFIKIKEHYTSRCKEYSEVEFTASRDQYSTSNRHVLTEKISYHQQLKNTFEYESYFSSFVRVYCILNTNLKHR